MMWLNKQQLLEFAKEHEATVALSLIVLAIVLIVVDLFLYANDTPGDTISYRIKNWAYKKYFALTFIWGALGGHFFLGKSEVPAGYSAIVGFIGIACIVLILFLYGIFMKPKVSRLMQLFLLIAGVLCGHYFWSIDFVSL